MNALLNMTGISKSFSGIPVLHDVSFDVKVGEVHVLAGENGAGKSTLMKILSGIHRDYTGTISLEGRTVKFSSPHHASRHGIAMIHQELSLIPSMSVADNIFLGREPVVAGVWLNRRKQSALAKAAMRRLGLDLDVDRCAGEFPVSVRQLIEIARALAFDARILIMDEPTSSLNAPEVDRLFALVENLKQTCAIIYITHKMEEIYRLADRITVLRDGRHIATEPAARLPKQDLVKKLVGRDLSEQFPARQKNTGPVLLEVKNFTSPNRQVRNISFTIRSGEILGVAGLQGSGNSELFHALFGSYGSVAPGRLMMEGKSYQPRSPAFAINNRLALLTNDRKGDGLIPMMGSDRNTTLASMKSVSPGGWMNVVAEQNVAGQYRDRMNIRMRSLDQPVCELSGGNQQKVVLAKWLNTRPKLLLLDEPTRGVDIGAKHEIYQWMNHWTMAGTGIMLITSELPELLAMSDRIIVLHRGEISAEYSREEATPEKIMHAAMGRV